MSHGQVTWVDFPSEFLGIDIPGDGWTDEYIEFLPDICQISMNNR
jgi:hypothetical protein